MPACRTGALLLLLCTLGLRAAEVIPPPPRDHFNDYAGIVSPAVAKQLNAELSQFERDTSNQILVAIFPRMQSPSSIEDYTTRVFEAWRPGEKARSNGAILFIFSQDRRMRIQTGYGLEATLPDALGKQILENEITPRFRTGDFTGGVSAGVRAMMAATRGEYRGTGRPVADTSTGSGFGSTGVVIFIFIALIVLGIRGNRRRGTVYGRSGRHVWIGPGLGSGGWGGGGSSRGGGGSFSGGGGSTGGGGASGSW